jgi:hypothetical protein
MSQEVYNLPLSSATAISWVIDRQGDSSLYNFITLDTYPSSNNDFIVYPTDNYIINPISNSIINPISNSIINPISNSIINPISNSINYDSLIYYPFDNSSLLLESVRSIPSELILNEDIQFNEEQCECCICMDQKEAENICQLNCEHTFCVTCIDTSLKTFKNRNQDVICALCRTNVTQITFKKQENKDKIEECLK